MKRLSFAGFTLIELVVVVAIVGILAAIAVPSYQTSVRKSRRADAEAALMNMQIRQEKWRANNTTYNATASAVGAPGSGEKISTYYSFTVPAATATTFTVQAAALGSQASDSQNGTSCATLSINQSGTRSPTACW